MDEHTFIVKMPAYRTDLAEEFAAYVEEYFGGTVQVATAGDSVEWGVRYTEPAPFREVGSVESYGTRPGGDTGQFTESEARYIAQSRHEVVTRTVTQATAKSEWQVG